MAEKEAPGEKGAAPAAAAGGGAMSAWMPVIAVVVLVPVLSYAMAMFVIAPQLEKRFAAVASASGSAGAESPGEAGHEAAGDKAHGAKKEATVPFEFKDVVSNLSGAMRSRYIKVSFTAYSSKIEFPKIAEENRAKLLDATIGVLARLSLADLEDPGAKSKVSNEIIYAMEAVLRERVVEEIYFSEFVVQ